MDFELQAVTDAGRGFVALCESHTQDFFARAAAHDHEGRFSHENSAALVQSGVMAATVPVELGGGGITLSRDLLVGLNRLARGDASTALAASMHLLITRRRGTMWKAAIQRGNTSRAEMLEQKLRDVVARRLIVAVAGSENGTSVFHPTTEGVRDGDGWRVNGRKGFATGSPAAHEIVFAFRVRDGDTGDRVMGGNVRRGNPGMVVQDDWDSLGMRASASQDVVFTDCFIANADASDSGPWGDATRLLFASSSEIIVLAGSFLGIAESARNIALAQVQARGRGGLPAIHHIVAEMEIALSAARAMLDRGAANVDMLLAADTPTFPPDVLNAAVREGQAIKSFVTRAAIEVVDHAMTLSGGGGYSSRNPLSRLYRDVRAGPFMQPFSPVEAFGIIGRIALGLPVQPA